MDYTKLSAPDFLKAVGTDADKWADAFLQITSTYDHPVDKGDMIGWFANAMMAMHDHLQGNPILNGDHAQYLLDEQPR